MQSAQGYIVAQGGVKGRRVSIAKSPDEMLRTTGAATATTSDELWWIRSLFGVLFGGHFVPSSWRGDLKAQGKIINPFVDLSITDFTCCIIYTLLRRGSISLPAPFGLELPPWRSPDVLLARWHSL